MRTPRESVGGRRSNLVDLVYNISYEVMPFKTTEQAVRAEVPSAIPLTVTATEAKGIEATVTLTERLRHHGYTVTPHLPARQFVDTGHVEAVLARLRAAGVRSVFVIGGDAPEPAGEFANASSLLQAMTAIGHPCDEVGIAGYPEGHATVPEESIDLALKQKAPRASHIITQICFDATTTSSWTQAIAASGIDLPIYLGIPGPVSRRKLMRISSGIGLGQSARFLQKQQNLLWRLLLPGGYSPTKLVRRLGTAVAGTPGNVRGLHIFTFNELRKTEAWRRALLAAISAQDARS